MLSLSKEFLSLTMKHLETINIKKISIILLTATILVGCSTSRHLTSTANYSKFRDNESDDLLVSTRRADNQKTEKQQRRVMYHASLSIVVKVPDTLNLKLSEIANKYDGYVLTLGNKTSIIRVKSDKLQSAIADISILGRLKSKLISGDDVTDQYTDFQIRLHNAHSARKRYLELLAKAENVDAALKVEKELERLNGEIDSLEGKLKRLEHLSEFSTITVYMEEKIKPGILGYIGIGLYKSVKWLFVRN